MEPEKYDVRGTDGAFVPSVSDDEIWAYFQEDPSVKRCADHFKYSRRQMRHRLAEIRKKLGVRVDPDPGREGKLKQLLASVPVEGPPGSKLSAVDVKLWGVAAKDEITQEIVTKGLDGISARYKLDAGSMLEFTPRDSNIVAYIPTGVQESDAERVFIIGDQQLGFWAISAADNPKSVRFEPFHDERSIDVMMQALAVYQPDRVVIVGDFLDFPQLSRFAKEPEFERTMQASVQEAFDLLCKIRDTVGSACTIDFIPGNHETRLVRAVGQTPETRGLYGLTRPGDKYPLHHIATILRFDDLQIACAAEYPSGEVWLAKRRGNIPGLVVTHADPKRKDMRADAIHGHLVLPAMETRQVFYEDGPVTYTRICVSGCGNYSDTGDKVRLTRTMTPSGRARMSAVPSFATVDIDRETGLRHYGLHIIHDGAVQFYGKVLSSAIPEAA